MDILDRIKQIRECENLSQENFSREIGMNTGTLRNYEQKKRKSIASTELLKITRHPRFEKYTMWLMTGKTLPESEQISPEIEKQRTA